MRPVLLLGFGIDVPKANGTGRRGWWCGCTRLCPISVGWRLFIQGSTIVLGEVNYGSVPVGHARGMRKIHEGGDKEIQRRALRLYWPASRYAINCLWLNDFDFFFFFRSVFFFVVKF